MKNAFVTDDPYESATGSLRLSLRKLNLEAAHIARMVAGLKLTKLAFEVPFWANGDGAEKEDAWAHIGLPEHKVVVVIGDTIPWITRHGFREKWRRHGFVLFGISKETVSKMRADDLASHITHAISKLKESTQ